MDCLTCALRSQWGELPPARSTLAAMKPPPSRDNTAHATSHSAFAVHPHAQIPSATTPSCEFSQPTSTSSSTVIDAQPSTSSYATSSLQAAASLAHDTRSPFIIPHSSPKLAHPSEPRLQRPACPNAQAPPSSIESRGSASAADTRDNFQSNDTCVAQARRRCWRCYFASAIASIICFCAAAILIWKQLHSDGNAAAAADTQLSKYCHSFYGVKILPQFSLFQDLPDASFLLFVSSLFLAAAARSNFIA
jgi:hypothetical protein